MILYVDAKYPKGEIAIDFIKAQLRSGKIVTMTWDESAHSFKDSSVSSRLKGVYFDEEYANGREKDLIGMKVLEAGFEILDKAEPTIYYPDDQSVLLIEISVYTEKGTMVVWEN